MLFDFQAASEMQRLLGSVGFLQRIIASHWDFLLIYSDEGKFVCGSLSNGKWLNDGGYGADVAIEELMEPEARDQFSRALWDAGRCGLSKTIESMLANGEDGSPRWLQSHLTPLSEDGAKYVVVLGKDISEQKQYEQSLKTMAYHDPLTSLPNRRGLEEHFQQMLAYSKRYRLHFAVLSLDLDDFKSINDSYGHQGGDELLKHFALKVGASLHGSDVIARIGGDEFVVLLANIPSVAELKTVIHRIYGNLRDGMTLLGRAVEISVSIGAAVYPNDGESYETLMKHTDAALYQVKGVRKNTFAVYNNGH